MGSDNKKIFEDAAAEDATVKLLVNKSKKISELPGVSKEQQLKEAISIVEEGETDWSMLLKDIDGIFAKRAREELTALSGREFLRYYFKLLEFEKPKVIRRESDGDDKEEDNVLIIEVRHSSGQFKENITIDIPSEDVTKKDN